jgi:hypothetical protein
MGDTLVEFHRLRKAVTIPPVRPQAADVAVLMLNASSSSQKWLAAQKSGFSQPSFRPGPWSSAPHQLSGQN